MPDRAAREHAQAANAERLRCPMAAVECMEGLAPVRELGREWHARGVRVGSMGSIRRKRKLNAGSLESC
jgi:hypothetical protein